MNFKKYKKYILRGIIGLLIIIILIFAFIQINKINNKLNQKVKFSGNNKEVAVINYNYLSGIDSGITYTIIIYTTNKNMYKYKVNRGETTIAGYNETKIANGKIKSKRMLKRLDREYKSELDSENNVEITYSIYKDDTWYDCESINLLATELFYKK